MSTYKKCPKQYYYRYIEKPEVSQDWSHLELGKCAHSVLELFHLHLMKNVVTPEDYHLVMKESFKQALTQYNAETLKPNLSQLKGFLQDYLDSIAAMRLT